MPVILTDESYPEVRAALDVTLEADRLPDSVIAMGPYQGDAEREAAAAVPGWASLTGDQAERFRVAVVLKTAARIAPAMPAITREDRLAFSFSQAAVNWVDRAAQLNARANGIIEELNPTPGASSTQTGWAALIFGKASSRRGGF